jgi:hypothetical protein
MRLTTEFNEKYKEYLEDSLSEGLAIEYPSVVQYLDELFQDLIKINGFKFSSIEKRLGLARFSTNLVEIIPFVGRTMTHEVEEKLNFLLSLEREIEVRLSSKK